MCAVSALTLSACSSNIESEATYPKTQKDQRRERLGSLTGDGGLFQLGGSNDASDEGANVGINVNSYLWRASLDTISFMPLVSADPFGGVLITDWYENPSVPGERFKITVTMMSRTLSSDSVKVSVFKQNLKQNVWRDATVSGTTARDLENKILTRARQLRVANQS